MTAALSHRNGIPFFCEKSALEIQSDKYERYHDVVLKHTALHLADELWTKYPMRAIIDYGRLFYAEDDLLNVTDIGCGVGRWIADLAQSYPKASCWGFDYSYQMLKRAVEYWKLNKEIELDFSHKGFKQSLLLQGKSLSNLQFGLADAGRLPLASNSQDLVLNSFLIDRLPVPKLALQEMWRVLQPMGKLICITPLNFTHTKHWDMFWPPHKLRKSVTQLDFNILDWNEDVLIEEPLDARGNSISWKCISFVAQKKNI